MRTLLARFFLRLDDWLHARHRRWEPACMAVDIIYGYGPDCVEWRDTWWTRAMLRLWGETL